MMKTISVLLLYGIIGTASFSESTLPSLPDGYYTGSDKLFIIAYVKVSRDTAIADLIYKDKFPRDLLTDTLAYDGSTNSWKGKNTMLYQKKRFWYIHTKNIPLFESTIKLKANEKQYKDYHDQHKKAALSRKSYFGN